MKSLSQNLIFNKMRKEKKFCGPPVENHWSKAAFRNRRVATRQRVLEDFKRVMELLFSNFEQLNSLKVAKKSQLWVVETFFFKNTGRGTIWVEKRWSKVTSSRFCLQNHHFGKKSFSFHLKVKPSGSQPQAPELVWLKNWQAILVYKQTKMLKSTFLNAFSGI